MVLVGSSLGSSGIFVCDFVFGCWVLSVRPEMLRWLRRSRGCHFVYFLTIQDCHSHRDALFLLRRRRLKLAYSKTLASQLRSPTP